MQALWSPETGALTRSCSVVVRASVFVEMSGARRVMAVRGSCFVIGAVSIFAFLALALFRDVASSPFFACRCGRVIFVFAAIEVLETPVTLVGEPLSG